MLPGRLWQEEILANLRGRRSLAMKLLLPLILLSPLMLERVPAHVRSGGLAVAVLFVGTFGSAVGLVRLREDRMLERLAVLPQSSARLLGEYILASVLFDGFQMLVPLVAIAILGGPASLRMPGLIACYLVALVTANALGALAALVASSSGEVHLYAALLVLVVGGLSAGDLVTPMPGPLEALKSLLPFHHLSGALLYAWGVAPPGHPVRGVFSGAVLLLSALLLSPRLFRFRSG
jgi:ABC-type multidrug transport system permease subunit